MKLNKIKEEALKELENIDLSSYITLIKSNIDEHPEGMDINIPINLLEKIEEICDNEKIPVYHVAESTLSIASTYNKLYTREKQR